MNEPADEKLLNPYFPNTPLIQAEIFLARFF
jgi:hypothetical protein